MDVFEIKLKNALIMAFNEEWIELEDLSSKSTYEFTEEYDREVLTRAFRALNKHSRKYRKKDNSNSTLILSTRQKLRRTILIAVLVAVMLAGAVIAYAFTHPEITYTVKKTLTEWAFTFHQNDQDGAAEEFVKVRPEIPDGFEITDEVEVSGLYQLQYENDNSSSIIFFTQSSADGLGMNINGEGDNYFDIKIKDNTGIAFHDTNDWTIIWSNDIYVFTVSGNVDIDILIRMAESLV